MFGTYAKNIILKLFIYILDKYFESWGWGGGNGGYRGVRWRLGVVEGGRRGGHYQYEIPFV